MLAAVKGIVRGNIIEVEDDIRVFDGADVVVTVLNVPHVEKNVEKKKKQIDWDSFVIPSERGKNVSEYMKEMRENDRI